MARPNKIGLDYFPLDVDFFEDEKMLAISGEFSVKGEIISLRLLCEIYRNGYYVEYSELLKNKLARLGGLSGGLVDEVVSKLVKYGFFDGSLFSEQNILTSNGIQKRFICASKRRGNGLCCNYCLISDVSVCKNYASDGVSVCKNAQSKINKSKKKENKKKEDSDAAGAATPPKPVLEILENRKNDFMNDCATYAPTYGKAMIRAFFDYWTEKNKSGTKMRFELEKTWELSKRLATWANRDKNFTKDSNKTDYEHKESEIIG
jgi:hypothetical protein